MTSLHRTGAPSILLATAACAVALLAAPPAAPAQTTTRVSVSSLGTQANNVSGGGPHAVTTSANGRFVAFVSSATNLVAAATSGAGDIFVHDSQTGATTLASVDSFGTPGNGHCEGPSISADGRFVTFASDASNLVTGDTNGVRDVFVHDRQTGATTLVSAAFDGTPADHTSQNPAISADGRWVAFVSFASNLVHQTTAGAGDIFVRDIQPIGVTTLVSVTSQGTTADAGSRVPSISADGRFVAFQSFANNLVPNDINGFVADVFIRDLQVLAAISLISVDSAGTQGNSDSGLPSISADGSFVAFQSNATNLVPMDTNLTSDIFVRNRNTGVTTRISVSSAGMQANNVSSVPSISADGLSVAFQSNANNLVLGDNGVGHIFTHNSLTGTTTRVSVSSSGTQGNTGSANASISADGRSVAFQSFANNLVPMDTNAFADVFVRAGPCPGDADGDNTVDFIDLNIVLSDFGQSGPALAGDLNHDGVVDFLDLNIVLSFFGVTC